MKKPVVFICYSRKDQKLKDKLVSLLKIPKSFEIWDDSRIPTGADWNEEIIKNISESNIAILLLTNDFLGSDYIEHKEVPRFLKRREGESLLIVPVLGKECLWKQVKYLAKMQVWTHNGKPLWRRGAANEAALNAFTDHMVNLVRNLLASQRKQKTARRKIS